MFLHKSTNLNAIGIDFGTTNTTVSRFDAILGKPVAVRLGKASDSIPSAVYVQPDGGLLFGEEAESMMDKEPARYSREFKMYIGETSPALSLADPQAAYSAKQLTSAFLHYILKRCRKEVFNGGAVDKAVITCPLFFSPEQRMELKEAAVGAGCGQVEIVPEPEAVGLALCTLRPEAAFSKSALVVDWSGSSLCMSVISRTMDGGISADPRLGKADFQLGGDSLDMRLWYHVCKAIQAKGGPDMRNGQPGVRQAAYRKIRQAKELLSIHSEWVVRLSSSNGPCPPVSVTRHMFQELIAGDVARATGMAKGMIASARGNGHAPERLVLAGGTCNIPHIAEALQQECGLPCSTWIESQGAAAIGAALTAGGATLPAPTPEQAAEQPAVSIPDVSLLTDALAKGDIVQTRKLVNTGVDVNGKDYQGLSPLTVAVTLDDEDMVTYLIANGANPRDFGDGKSVFNLARGENMRTILTAECDRLDNALLETAGSHDALPVLIALIRNGADINYSDRHGLTPLMNACAHGETEKAGHLIDIGVRINTQDAKGRTPLILAAENGHTDTVAMLIKNGASVNVHENTMKSALVRAALRKHPETVSTLLKHGAKAPKRRFVFRAFLIALLIAVITPFAALIIDDLEHHRALFAPLVCIPLAAVGFFYLLRCFWLFLRLRRLKKVIRRCTR